MSREESSDRLDLIDIAILCLENIRSLVLVPLLAGLIGLACTFAIKPTYTATTRLLPPQQQQSASSAIASQLGAMSSLIGATAAIKNPADQYASFLKSRSVADAIIHRFNLRSLYDVDYATDARRKLDKHVKVTVGSRDGIITIEVDDVDPQRAADMANAFVEELGNLSKSLAITEASQRRLFFESQLRQAKNNLSVAEAALRGSGVSAAVLKTMPQSALEAIARLKAQITAQEIALAAMRTSMTDANPELRSAQQALAALRLELAKAEQRNPAKPGSDGGEYVSRYREFKYNETLFELLARQYEMARLDEAREGTFVQVIDKAVPPDRRTSPRRTLTSIVVAAIALLFALLAIYARASIKHLGNRPDSAARLATLRRVPKT